MKTYVFPGQGSQKKGMGGYLFDKYNDFTNKADQILGYSIKELCLNDPLNQLKNTRYTQPVMFVVNVLHYLKKLEETSLKPDFLAGHSLGEYSALFAAGVFDFVDGLRLVKKRAELMSQISGGKMAAVIGLDEFQVQAVIREKDLANISIANYNSPSQFVIAGPSEDIIEAKSIFEKAGAMLFIPLNVGGAFHTRYMKPVQDIFEQYIKAFDFSDINIPVIANVTGKPYRNEEIKRNLVYQIARPVLWVDSIRYLARIDDMSFEEIGPGKVLKNLINKIID
jgi:trans-AT polyketide synthase/acyltransferase/oxidoreductase domain-containing protein